MKPDASRRRLAAAVEQLAAELVAEGFEADAIQAAFIGWAAGSATARTETPALMAAELRALAAAIDSTRARLTCQGRA